MKSSLFPILLGSLTLLSLSGSTAARQRVPGGEASKPATERDLHYKTHARLTCATFDLEDQVVLMAHVTNVGSKHFYVLANFPGVGRTLLGQGWTDAAGTGEAYFALPSLDALPTNTEIEFQAFYRDERGQMVSTLPVPYLANAKPAQTLDFDWPLDKAQVFGGTVIDDQWAGAGITIRAENPAGADLAILFDSADPTANDLDLATPGRGPMNQTAQGKLLVVAGNDADGNGDGVIDVPDSADAGGRIVFEFAQAVILSELELIDVDLDEPALVRASRPGHEEFDLRIPDLGNLTDGNRVCMGFTSEPITRLEIVLSGSAGIAELSFLPVTAVLDFDRTMTGVPLGLLPGTQLAEQFAHDLGFVVRGNSWLGSLPDAAILMDTAQPAPLDRDLRTPGTHPTNTVAQGLAMILPQNVRDDDLDGRVDAPDSNCHGGILSFEFEYDIVFESAGLLDVDLGEDSWVELYSKETAGSCAIYTRIAAIPLPRLGDNSWQELCEVSAGTTYPGVRRVDFVLDGSTAVTNLTFRRDQSFGVR
jgi:hypothetical protein